MFRGTIGRLLLAAAMVAGLLSLLGGDGSMTAYLALVGGFFVVRVGLGVGQFRRRGELVLPTDWLVLIVGSLVVANLCVAAPVAAFWEVMLLLWYRLGQGGSVLVNYAAAIGATVVVVAWLADLFYRVGAKPEPNLEQVLVGGPKQAQPEGFRAET